MNHPLRLFCSIEESGWTEEDGNKADLAEFATKLLMVRKLKHNFVPISKFQISNILHIHIEDNDFS